MNFRKATESDAQRCLEIYNSVIDWEAVNGDQTLWRKDSYPAMEHVTNAIASGDMYILEDIVDGKTVSVASGIINRTQSFYYKNFTWNIDAEEDEVLVLHTFAVDEDLQRCGYGVAFMKFYAEMAKSVHCKVLRLDTVTSNIKSRNLYKKLGFKQAGFWEGAPYGITLTFIGLDKKV